MEIYGNDLQSYINFLITEAFSSSFRIFLGLKVKGLYSSSLAVKLSKYLSVSVLLD
jgi:hypothetical protein